jgi:receptor-type tyrosine-protein phosphatase Q
LLFSANAKSICTKKIDLGFILDNSGSVGYNNFQRMKSFVKDLTDFYKLGPDETRVSVMSFASSARIHIAFSAYFSDKRRFDSAVDSISYTGGGTATATALNLAYSDMFTTRYGMRNSGKDQSAWVPSYQSFKLFSIKSLPVAS